MNNESDVIEMMSETKAKLDDIKALNKEIHSALDLLEERRGKTRTGAHTSTTKENSSNDDEVSSEPSEPSEIRTETDTLAGAERKTVQEQNDSAFPNNEEQSREGSTSNTVIKPKGILKAPRAGDKQSYGFKERLNLSVDHVIYGSKLRRFAVEMHQDNRICLKFGLDHNIGSTYQSKRPPPAEIKDVIVSKPHAYKDIQQNTQVQSQKWKTSDAKTSKANSKSGTSVNIPHQEHPGKSSRTAGKPDRKEQQRKVQKQQTRLATKKQSRDQPSEQQVQMTDQQMGLFSEVLKSGDNPLQLRKDAWVNMMIGCGAFGDADEEQKAELRQNLGTFLDTFFGEGQTVNLGDFLNTRNKEVTKDEYMKKIKAMLDQDLSEDDEHQLDQMAGMFFDENGKIDLLKCMKGTQSFMKGDQLPLEPGQALQGDDEEDSSDDNDTPQGGTFPQPSIPALPHTVETSADDKEDDSEEERTDIDPALWVQYANEEIEKGRVARDVREPGMDTILCVDLSRSMKGIAWKQATTFIKQFVEGIQNTTLMDTAYEHIALVTFGSETRVQQHLTCDYVEISRKLDRLKPGGPSPLYAGLQMVHAAVIGAGNQFVSNGYRMSPRVFLITDGKTTPAGMISGPDKSSPDQMQQEMLPILDVVKTLHDKFHVNFYPVPVGEFDLTILENIVKISKGKLVSPEDWRMQSRVFKNYLEAAKLCGGPFAKMLAPGLSRMMLDAIAASPDDKAQMEEFIRTHAEDEDSDKEVETFPPLGSRIRLHLPGATIMASRKAQGTVTKHFSDGHIGVTWDKANADGELREKLLYHDSIRTVRVVDEPRVLHGEMIAEGCRVKRGKDWNYPDQDGGAGNLGNVFGVKANGIVSVRWDNGNKYTYKFGAEGKFDLEIVGQSEETAKKEVKTKHKVPVDELSEEMRVQRMNERNLSIFDCEDKEKTDKRENKKNRTQTQNLKSDSDQGYENTVSRNADSDIDKLNQRNRENGSAEILQHQPVTDLNKHLHTTKGSATNTGAKPKTGFVKQPGQVTETEAQWMWKDGDTWRKYQPDINEKIEAGFKQNPRGTTLIKLNDSMFRVVFPRMEQVNVTTKEKHTVIRNT